MLEPSLYLAVKFPSACFLRQSKTLAAAVLAFSLAVATSAVELPKSSPERVGLSASRLSEIDKVIGEEISQRHLPGAVVLVSRNGRVVWDKAYGNRAVEPNREAMTTDTIFDLASLTKVVATATSIMILLERGKLRLSDPVSRYIPEL